MAINLKSLKRSGATKPPITVIYASHGLGKTSLAAGAPSPVFLQTEDGLGRIEADTFGLLRSYDEIVQAMGVLYNEETPFKTVVLDSAGWAEPHIWNEACKQNGWANVETPGYGRGYAAAVDVWRTIFDGLTMLRDERNMGILILAHAMPVEYASPDVEAYSRFQPKLHKLASALLQEYADCVWFMNYPVSILKDDPKDKSSRARGVGGSTRMLYTTERPQALAKNRYGMPDKITLPDNPTEMWAAVAQYIPYYNNAAVAAPVTE